MQRTTRSADANGRSGTRWRASLQAPEDAPVGEHRRARSAAAHPLAREELIDLRRVLPVVHDHELGAVRKTLGVDDTPLVGAVVDERVDDGLRLLPRVDTDDTVAAVLAVLRARQTRELFTPPAVALQREQRPSRLFAKQVQEWRRVEAHPVLDDGPRAGAQHGGGERGHVRPEPEVRVAEPEPEEAHAATFW